MKNKYGNFSIFLKKKREEKKLDFCKMSVMRGF